MNELFESVAQKKPRWKQWEKVEKDEDWGAWLSDAHKKTDGIDNLAKLDSQRNR